MLERLVHVSAAAPGLGLGGVFAIIRGAHPRNAAEDVTGALVFLDGWFAQILEGPGPALAALAGRLARDPRHAPDRPRLRERALARLFPGQPLALRTRACLDPRLMDEFGYGSGCGPGFPRERFPADVLAEFLVRACRARAVPGGARHGTRHGTLDREALAL